MGSKTEDRLAPLSHQNLETSSSAESPERTGIWAVLAMASSTSYPLADKIIIVTGATSGIGASIAKHVIEAGATAVLAGRREDRLQQEVTSLSALIAESMVYFDFFYPI